ncbi:MAG TPA: hypothetical protein PKU80_04350 [Candidatus Limiplasma sp.]|nr:hypothetical protein [Candidatus Limiplasma sp.]HRX08026.1 hypothetical protein [Candidatus Limiplasma sp.]
MPYRPTRRYCYFRYDYVLFHIHFKLNEANQPFDERPKCKAAPSCNCHNCQWKTGNPEDRDFTVSNG